MAQPGSTGGSDINAGDGQRIVKEAASWKGTEYQKIGPSSVKQVGGDCSGSTHRIYEAAGFSYTYQATATFAAYVATSGKFRELKAGEARQEGDLILWSSHMAIYTSFADDKDNATTPRTNKSGTPWTQRNDMWSATHVGGPAYGPNKIEYFSKTNDQPRYFRYQKAP